MPKVLQIPQTKQDITLFKASIDTLHDFGKKVYTFYNDGYRSLVGFAKSYEYFCCENNGYAIYYNQLDFNWGLSFIPCVWSLFALPHRNPFCLAIRRCN